MAPAADDASRPTSGDLDIRVPEHAQPSGGPHEPTWERDVQRAELDPDAAPEVTEAELSGVLSSSLAGAAMGRIITANAAEDDMLRTCDFDAPGGPLEVDQGEWDGVSVWIGQIPNHGVRRRDGAGDNSASPTAASARASTDIFLKLYTMTEALEREVAAFGEGIEGDETGLTTVCLHASNSWALVTFRRREDAEAMLAAGLSMAPGSEFDTERTPLLLKRAIDADEAKAQLEEDARMAQQKHDMVVLAVSRIQSWVKRSGKQLADLFAKIDVDGSGDFNVQEFRADMLSIGLTFTDEVIEALMKMMDDDGDGSIDVDEFIAKMDKFAHEMNESASSILAALVLYMDTERKTVPEIFAANDGDDSGHLDPVEFHDALLAIGIQQSERTARQVMRELDMDQDGDISLAELTARLTSYRRKRRAFAAKVLSNVFDFINKTNASATRIFSRVDSDGTGDLDVLEFQEALRRMGQNLTPDQVHEIMNELDLDQSGTIGVSEFLDKLKLAESERQADMRKCKRLFQEADQDGSGTLDTDELASVAIKMGLGEQMKEPEFLRHMMAEMEAGHLLKDHEVKADGTVSPKSKAGSRGSSPNASPRSSPHSSRHSSPRGSGGSSSSSNGHGHGHGEGAGAAAAAASSAKAEIMAMPEEEALRTLHVGHIKGLELMNENTLTEMFEKYGEVSSVTLRQKDNDKVRDKTTRPSSSEFMRQKDDGYVTLPGIQRARKAGKAWGAHANAVARDTAADATADVVNAASDDNDADDDGIDGSIYVAEDTTVGASNTAAAAAQSELKFKNVPFQDPTAADSAVCLHVPCPAMVYPVACIP